MPSGAKGLRVRYGIDAEFLADMGEFLRIGETAIHHHRAEFGEPRRGKEQPRQASAGVELHQPPIHQPLGHRRDLWLAGLRAAPPGPELEAFGHGRQCREDHVEFAANIVPFARGEPGVDLLKLQGGSSVAKLGARCRIHMIDNADHVFSKAGPRAMLQKILSDELFATAEIVAPRAAPLERSA